MATVTTLPRCTDPLAAGLFFGRRGSRAHTAAGRPQARRCFPRCRIGSASSPPKDACIIGKWTGQDLHAVHKRRRLRRLGADHAKTWRQQSQIPGFALFWLFLLALLLYCNRNSWSSSRFLRFPGFPQGAKTLHVLANRNGLLLDICHRPRTFFREDTLPFSARDAYGRGFSGLFGGHLPIQICN